MGPSWRLGGKAAALLAGVALAVFLVACGEDADGTLRGSGTVEVDSVTVGSELGGRVATVAVDLGDPVAAGQALVELDSALIDSQLAEAEAGLAAAEAELERLEEGATAVELKLAFAELMQAFAQRDLARLAVERARLAPTAAGEGAVSEAEAALSRAELAVTMARAAYQTLRAGPTAAEMVAAEAGPRQARAARDLVLARRNGLTLVAPMAGQVIERAVEPGEIALPGAVLLRLADPREVSVTAYLPQTEIGRLRLGQAATVTVDGLPDESFEGQISYIAPQAEFTPRTVQTADQRANLVFAVRVRLPNPDGRLRAGMAADLVFDGD